MKHCNCHNPPLTPGNPTPSKPPPRPPRAQTATHPTTSAAPGHHRLSPPPATATPGIPLAITAMTTTSALAPAITPPVTITSALVLAISGTSPTAAATSAPAPATLGTPPAHAETPITHHNYTSLLIQPLPAPAHLLAALPLHVSAFPVQDLPCRAICLNPHCCPMQSPGLTLSPGFATRHQDPGLSPRAYLSHSI
ncbi:hypothetical protein C0993_005997 [Termitomyces sp. T159_Od127]|nr:hypothetical protein C0993_005997 [Termitomyces sp. T159_Od127]